MGLSVSVGIQSFVVDAEGEAHWRKAMDELSSALAGRGVVWRTPEKPGPMLMRSHCSSFPYFYLSSLYRVRALQAGRMPVTPIGGPEELESCREMIEETSVALLSHMMTHAIYTGYYVPVDFEDPMVLYGSGAFADGMVVGSSQALLEELRWCAPELGIRLDDDESLPDSEAERLFNLPGGADFEIESTAWLTLHEACLASIASGEAIVYH